MHPRNYSWEGSFAFVIMLICTRNLMLSVTLIQAKSGNTQRDIGIQGKHHQNQAWRISWQIPASNGWVRKQQPAHKHCMNSFPWSTRHSIFLAQQQVLHNPCNFPLHPCSWVLPSHPVCWGGLVSVTHVCACMWVCVCCGPRDDRSLRWEIRSWFRVFGLTLHGWVKAV